MSTNRKPRADSVLKTLPPARQGAIAEHLRDHTLEETRAWLAADGLKTNTDALSQFLSWHSLQGQLRKNESTVETLLANLQQENPDWSPEQIQVAGQSFFTALAMQQQDPKQWYLIQQTALKKEQLSLDRQKFQRETAELFVKWSADAKARDIASSNLSHADKIEQLGQAMFGEDWS